MLVRMIRSVIVKASELVTSRWRLLLCLFFFVFASNASALSVTALSIFENLNTSLEDIYPALQKICWIAGVFFVLKGLYMLKKMGYKTAFMGGGAGMTGPAIIVVIGVILINTPAFIKIMLTTLFAQDSVQSTASWEARQGSDTWYSAITPMIGLIQVIGIVAFLRGWILLVKANNENAPPGNMSKGFLHVVAGVMAINITGTIDVINKTLGL